MYWYLARYSEHVDKIRVEVDQVDTNDANALARLPHLNAVINEVLRLVPPAMTGGARITGPRGLMVDGTLIPPYTKVTAPKYVIQRGNCIVTERYRTRLTHLSLLFHSGIGLQVPK